MEEKNSKKKKKQKVEIPKAAKKTEEELLLEKQLSESKKKKRPKKEKNLTKSSDADLAAQKTKKSTAKDTINKDTADLNLKPESAPDKDVKADIKSDTSQGGTISETATTSRVTPKKINILFICTGNTCRSAMAEYIAKDYIKKRNLSDLFMVSSAGLSAYYGDDMPENAKSALKTMNVSFENHNSKPATPELLEKSDLIICMTRGHEKAVKDYATAINLKSVILPAAYFTGGNDVLDPYGADEYTYIKTAEQLEYIVGEAVIFAQKKLQAN